MTNIAWKNLVRERARLAISVGGVAFSVLLILILRGLYAGITAQSVEYIRSVGADLWVAQAGSPGDFFHSVSLIPEATAAAVEAVPGVDEALPLVSLPVVFRLAGSDVDFRLMGVDPVTGAGGPPEIVSGKRVPAPGEVVVDRVFADNHAIILGQILDVRDLSLEVVGIARGGNTIVSQFAWASISDATRLMGAEGFVNYLIVRTADPPGEVATRIRDQVDDVNPLTQAEFEERNTADIREAFLPIVWVLVLIALGVGIAVIGLTIYAATIEKSREYGVLKAIGFSNRRLYRIVYQQSLTAAAAGTVAGTVLAYLLGALLERALPSFVVAIGAGDVALAAAAALVMALISSLMPIRPVARLDPASVFRV